MRIGFIGTGVMGKSMASHLLKAGNSVYVYNRTKEKAYPLLEQGAIWCDSVKEIASQCQIIFTIIGMPQDVKEVYLSEDGLINHAMEKAILVDMTTSTPELAQIIYEKGKEKSIYCLDAPVTGGDIGAQNGTLTIMVGGDEVAYQNVYPYLTLMGKTIAYMGPAGKGQHTKMANQIAIAGAMLGTVEALSYANEANLDLASVLRVLSSGSASSWQLENMGPRMINGDFNPGFFIKHFIKDMKIALSEADLMDIDLPGLDLVLKLYIECQNRHLENEGTQALFKLYEKK